MKAGLSAGLIKEVEQNDAMIVKSILNKMMVDMNLSDSEPAIKQLTKQFKL